MVRGFVSVQISEEKFDLIQMYNAFERYASNHKTETYELNLCADGFGSLDNVSVLSGVVSIVTFQNFKEGKEKLETLLKETK